MPYVNIPESKLVPNIASTIGRLEGSILADIDNTLTSVERDLQRGILSCENTSVTGINNLSQEIEKVKRVFSKYKSLTGVLRSTGSGLSRIVTVLKKLPIPGLSLTAGTTTTFSDLLHLVKETSTQLIEDADGIDSLITDDNTTQSINSSEQKLERLKILVDLNCCFERVRATIETTAVGEDFSTLVVEEEDIEKFKKITSRAASRSIITSEVEKLQKILIKYGTLLQQVGVRDLDPCLTFEENRTVATSTSTNTGINTSTSRIPFQDYKENFTGPDGRQYLLQIITLSPTFTLATQRQAIAQDINTREVLFSGTPSFASNPDILIDELKFKINTSV